MARLRHSIAISFLVLFTAFSIGAQTNGFQCQLITLPGKGMPARFIDMGQDNRADLLAVDSVAKHLLIYRQRASGFTNAPDQMIDLPPHTAWIASYPMEAGNGCGLLMSTATGVVYYRQNGGTFESEPRTLIKSDQIFTNDELPFLISLGTNAAIPMISATQARLYRRNEAAEWTSGPPVALEGKRGNWAGSRNAWTLGANSSHSLNIRQSIRATPEETGDEKPENEAIAKLMAEMKKAGPMNQPQTLHLDLNRDGRTDFIVWQALGANIDYRTDVYIFLRGEDGKLPGRPTQALHCQGIPIPIRSTQEASPIGDLRGDGAYELVLIEPNVTFISKSTLVDMLLTRGVDLALTVRTFNHGAFSRSPDATIPISVVLSWYGMGQWPFFIDGDFNGDGKVDLVVQRSSDEWNIFFSTNDGHWFKPQPAMKFKMPSAGYFERHYLEINDLNGDGRSDIVVRDMDDPRLCIFLTQPQPTKGNP